MSPSPHTPAPPRRSARRWITALSVAVVLSTAYPSLATETVPAAQPGGGISLIITLGPGGDPHLLAQSLRLQGGEIDHVYTHALRGVAGEIPRALLPALRADPRVEHIEPDQPAQLSATYTPAPWNLDRLDQRRGLDRSYSALGGGRGVDAYVLDTGVRASHIELRGRVQPGRNLVRGQRGTGDCHGHGTHVAGTLAGAQSGVAREARIVPVRVFDCAGQGPTSQILAGVDWVTGHHAKGAPAVANLSFRNQGSPAFERAVRAMIADGVLTSASAGNQNADACRQSPANISELLTVAAVTSRDRRWASSNWGVCVDIFAPGVNVTSAGISSDTERVALTGTSMAAPHVAGAAALLLGQRPTMTPIEVTRVLHQNATRGVVGDVRNAPNLLLFSHLTPDAGPVGAPGRPQNVTASTLTIEEGVAEVSWQRASSGSAITSSQVRVYRRGGELAQSVQISGDASAVRVRGLRAGEQYYLIVRSTNAVGTGGWSPRSREVEVLR